MKKLLITILFTLFSAYVFSQTMETFKSILIDNGSPGDKVSLDVTDDINIIRLYGSPTLSTNWQFVASGSPEAGTKFYIINEAAVSLNSNTFSILGAIIPAELSDKDFTVTSVYNGSGWDTHVFVDMIQSDFITNDMFDDTCISGDEVKDTAISFDKIQHLDDGELIIGNGSNRPAAQSITGDISITNTGVVSITGLAIVNADINAAANIAYSKLNLTGSILDADLAGSIAHNKMAALTASRVMETDGSGYASASSVTSTELGYVSGVTSSIQTQLNTKQDTTLTDGRFWIGDGSNIATERAISGDISISNTGVASIAGTSIVNADINGSAQIDASKIANGSVSNAEFQYINSLTSNAQTQIDGKLTSTLTDGDIFIGNGSNVATGVTMGGDATINNSGTLDLATDAVETLEIEDLAVTAPKVEVNLTKDLILLYASFEANFTGGYQIRLPYDCEISTISVSVIKLIEATDDATLTFQDNAGNNFAGSALSGGALTITKNSTIGTQFYTTVTGNNTFSAGDDLQVTTAKATNGGVVVISIEATLQ